MEGESNPRTRVILKIEFFDRNFELGGVGIKPASAGNTGKERGEQDIYIRIKPASAGNTVRVLETVEVG